MLIFRVDKANAQIITRSRSGPQTLIVSGSRNSGIGTNDQLVSGKATPEEIKEKMEQQLRMQRAAHQQKRALENLKTPGTPVTQLVKVTSNSAQGMLYIYFVNFRFIAYKFLKNVLIFVDGTLKLVTKVAIPANSNSSQGKSQLTSLLTTPNQKFVNTRRIYMAKSNNKFVLYLPTFVRSFIKKNFINN